MHSFVHHSKYASLMEEISSKVDSNGNSTQQLNGDYNENIHTAQEVEYNRSDLKSSKQCAVNEKKNGLQLALGFSICEERRVRSEAVSKF